jgi:hypothetical protein
MRKTISVTKLSISQIKGQIMEIFYHQKLLTCIIDTCLEVGGGGRRGLGYMVLGRIIEPGYGIGGGAILKRGAGGGIQ